MGHAVFYPRTAVREEKRQANEALGRSFCKTVAETVTNSDSSAKRKLKIQHSSGLVDLMLAVPKGSQIETSTLRANLLSKHPKRSIVVELATAKASGRPVGEVAVVDQAEGMSAAVLREALDDIGGNKLHLSGGVMGRNLFGRGLSDVLRAHLAQKLQTIAVVERHVVFDSVRLPDPHRVMVRFASSNMIALARNEIQRKIAVASD